VAVTRVQPNPELLATRFVYDIVLHEPEQIRELLSRVEQLAGRVAVREDDPGIALVLHGPEVGLFARENYARYKDLVDRAAALDAQGVIEIKVCATRMRQLGFSEEDMPPFAEIVPFGPAEVDRLVRRGYVLM
jgi:intracellular sulfur oxidation DsrE/DsrF family protein